MSEMREEKLLQEDWRALAEHAAQEQDSEKLLLIVSALSRALDQKNTMRGSRREYNRSQANSYSQSPSAAGQ